MMVASRSSLRKVGLAALLAAACCAALLFIVPSPAQAWTTGFHNFCWGVTLPGKNHFCESLANDGQAGYVTEVHGSGKQHSVCVRAGIGGVSMCSGGPLQGVYNGTPPGTSPTTALISNNASGANTVYGGAVYCVNPGC